MTQFTPDATSEKQGLSTALPSQRFKPLIKLVSILLCLIFLSGCDLNYAAKHPVLVASEQALIEKNSLDTNSPAALEIINTLSFSPHDADQIVNFNQHNKDLLLKVTIINPPQDVSEFTLSVFPKYLHQVSYFNHSDEQGYTSVISQSRNQPDSQRYFSSQRYAFNIDHSDINKNHYLLIQSDHNRYAQVEVMDTNSYIKADGKFSHFFTLVYSIILAMVLFNAVFYLHTRDNSYLLYSLYMAAALYSLLWQEGKIAGMPWLAWQVMGVYSGLIFFIISDALAILFFYQFLQLSVRQSWLVKIVLLCVIFRLGMMLTALVQFHLLDSLHYNTLSSLFNLSVLISTLLIWIIIWRKTMQGFPQAKYLFVAWSLLLFAVVLRLVFAFNPRPDLIWMPHSYELGVMLEGLILAFAMANRSMALKKQQDQAFNKYTAAERSIQEHQLITEFQRDMQYLVKDPTLTAAEVQEKINIKFHLLINKAFPIKHSLIHVDEQLQGICTTGLKPMDTELMNYKLKQIFTSKEQHQTAQFEIVTTNKKIMSFLYLPLNSNEFEDTSFIFGLKNNQPINSNLISEFRAFCNAAYAALIQAREIHQVALAANLDSMTGVYNRGSIEQVIKKSLKKYSRTTVAYVDLDNLKTINDQFGHATGDQCIIEFVVLLEKSLKDNAKLGRIGGDEFIAVFSDIEFELCETLLELFMEQLERQQLTDENLSISTSIGLAESRINETKKSLLEKADVALYHAKAQGKNRLTIYTTELQNEAS